MAGKKHARKNEPQRISKRTVDAFKPGNVVWDSVVTGLAVRCQKKARVYTLKYRFAGRQRWYSIGKHGSPWTVDEARIEAKRLLGLVADGVDPAEMREEEAKDVTVSRLCDLYLEAAPNILLKGKGRAKKASSLATDRSNIERHIKVLLGRKRLRSISRRDVERFQENVAAGKTAADIKTGFRGRARITGGKGTAARATAILGAVFTYAIREGYVSENPVKGVELYKSEGRERFLTSAELAKLGEVLIEAKGVNPVAISAIRALILTGARKSEILGLRWEDIDFENSGIHLPDSKTGKKTIPLAAAALELFEGLPRGGSPYVFPATKGEGHYLGLPKVWAKLKKRAGLNDVTIHTLRHSFASIAVAGGDSLILVGKVLGHVQTRTTEKYSHLDLDPLRAVADRAANTIAAAMNGTGGEVVELPNRKA